ncbi:MAG TPA: BamA/TamA family outer membrane protein [Pirellulales bacterium]|jgi:outer membrane protein insertion porin family
MVGGRFDVALLSRVLAICLGALLALAGQSVRAQFPAAAPPGIAPTAPTGQSFPSGYAPPAGPVPQGPPPADAAPVSSTPEVAEVRVEGNKAVGLQKISPHIKTRPGRPLDKSTVEDDVKRLTKTHQFISVEPRYERTPAGGIVIIFHLVERPMIRHLRIYGSSKSEKTLAKKAGIKVGDPLDPYAVEEARTKIEEYLHSKAYSQASVTIIEGTKPGDTGVRMMVNEGLKQKVWAVEFVGNTVAPDDRLQTQIQSKKPILWLIKGEVDYDRINEDVRRLTDYYRGLGFFRARVGREFIYNEKQSWMTLTFFIYEGPRYVVNNVAVIGNSRLESEQLTKNLKLKGGDFFDQSKLTKDISGVQDKYGEVGYIFADVQPETRFLEQPGQLDLVYKIEEGDRYRVGRIDVKIGGDNPHTRRTAVLNRLTLRTGDIANTRKLRESERRLKASAMFATNPQQGLAPKIVFARPGMDDGEEDDDVSVARKPGGRRGGNGNGPVQPGPGLGGMGPGGMGSSSMGGMNGMGGMGGMGGGGMNGMGFNGQSPDPEPEPTAESDPGFAAHDFELQDRESAEIELVPDPSPPLNPRREFTTVARPRFGGDGSLPVVRAQSPGMAGAPVGAYNSSAPSFGQQPLGRTNPDAAIGNFRSAVSGGGILQTQYQQRVQGGYAAPGAAPVYGQPATSYPPPANSYAPPTYPQNGYPPAGSFAAQPPNSAPAGGYGAPGGYAPPAYGQSVLPPPSALPGAPPPAVPPLVNNAPGGAVASPGIGYNGPGDLGLPESPASIFEEEPAREIPLRVMANETQTGRLMLGVGVNSNAGLIGNITLDEQNFDWRRFPTSWEDIRNATAWRGGGQQFRIQASPGTVYQQYSINFHNPYLFDTPISFGLNGSYFTRIYQDWTERRLGARVSLGYQFLFDPNLSTVVSFRGENVNISAPTIPTPPPLEQVLGNNALFIGQWQVIHDTRDSSFLPTQGHRLNLSLEQAFGSYTFPRATIDVSQHFLLHERPDTSGRHTLTLSNTTGFTGSNTPIYENYFAGGYTTLRGFYFRGASPLQENVQVGGHFEFINTVEYMFPITGDDMLRGVTFCDFGTVEPNIEMTGQDFRISPGVGLRVTIPAMGPAPIALDFAAPIHHAPGDRLQLFSFFIGVNR